jgi:predicted DNA-binding transcriptional regulator AlpA
MNSNTEVSHTPTLPVVTPAGSIEIQRMARVSQRLDVSKSLLFKMMAEGAFPQPFSINGGKATGWLSTTIDQWILQRAAAGSSARGVQK